MKARLAQVGATREVVTAYLTFAGIPVRIVTTLVTKTYGARTSTVDVRGVNAPVATTPPPASQTITLGELHKLGSQMSVAG